eukprot:TRINITY_DN83227_c0_g1_i1.p2 TRINITY_DN83227_c0_g1~~TRINITY_DN83227_c0_g1_i1.p2  ORF type:complete len:527 (-),score=133.66 TRINITY_DN83227_c0_g1_i1:102-1682(-)
MAATVEAAVCKETDLHDGQMQEFEVGEAGKVLVVRENGKFSAMGAKCTHYGAPLKNGVLSNGRVRCPWHGACFSTATGDIEDYPGVDCVHVFPTRVADGQVHVTVDPEKVKNFKRQRIGACGSGAGPHYAIIGGGPAGATCADVLRQEGFEGRITIFSREEVLPYDRPKLSKAMAVTAAEIALRPADYWASRKVDLALGAEVTNVNVATKKITLGNGTVVDYDKVFIAPGGNPRTVNVEGKDLANIHVLRSPSDSNAINDKCTEGTNLVVVGSSFIGMEVASALAAKKPKGITVIGMEKVPFERVLGERIGTAMQQIHEEKGVVFKMQRVVKRFEGADGKITAVVLDNDEVLPADLVVIGAGIIPNTGFIEGAQKGPDGSVLADEHLQVAADAYAGGDACRYTHAGLGVVRIEHYGMAQYHGRVAALNMVGKLTTVTNVPFFWTVQYGKSIRYCGHGGGWDDVVVTTDAPPTQKFAAFYTRGEQVIAVVGLGVDPLVATAAELFAAGKMPPKSALEPNIDLAKFLH